MPLCIFPAKVYYTAYNLVTGKPRDIYGCRSWAQVGRQARSRRRTRSTLPAKVASLFTVLGAVNLFVALFNFVPLLPGRWACRRSILRSLRRAIARLFGRPDPGPVDTARLLPVAYVVGGVILIRCCVDLG